MRRLLLWVPPLAYMLLIFHVSAQSDPMPELTSRVWDKWLHLVEYGALAVLFCRALVGEGLGRRQAFAIAFAATSAYGLTDEWHQLDVPGRMSSALDWLADALGAALGVVAYAAVRR